MPRAAIRTTLIVIVDWPLPGAPIVGGLKDTATPNGEPVANKLMELLNPPLTVVVMVEVPTLPCATLSDDGEAEIVNVPVALSGNVNNSTKLRKQHQRSKRACELVRFMASSTS